MQVVKAFQEADGTYSIDKPNTILRRSLKKLTTLRQSPSQIQPDTQSLQSNNKVSTDTL